MSASPHTCHNRTARAAQNLLLIGEPRDANRIARSRQGGHPKGNRQLREGVTAYGAGSRVNLTSSRRDQVCFALRERPPSILSDVQAAFVRLSCVTCRRGLARTDAVTTKSGWWIIPLAAAVSVACATSGLAQVASPLGKPARPPWNALEVFEPMPFASIWELSEGDHIAPEDRLVRLRQHPGYEAVGIRAGSWMYYPSMTLGTLYDSNVFASNTNERGDVALLVAPMLRAQTLWERHEIALQASARSYFYSQNPGLNQTNASFIGRSRLDITHDRAILTRFEMARRNVDVGTVTSPAGAVEPTPYNLFSGDVAYRQEFNRLTASVGGRVRSYDFQSTRAQDGTIINQDSRDGPIYAAHGRIDYAYSPTLGFFGAMEGNRRDLQGTPTQSLASSGYRMLAGTTIQLSRLIVGEIGLGYESQRFDSSQIGTVSGPAYRALLVWRPTRTVDVWFGAEEFVTQVSETSASAVKANAVQVGVDYELLRNAVLSVSGMYENDKFFGQPRDDDVYVTRARLKYQPNRFSTIAVHHKYLLRDSSDPLLSYDKHEVGLNVTARF